MNEENNNFNLANIQESLSLMKGLDDYINMLVDRNTRLVMRIHELTDKYDRILYVISKAYDEIPDEFKQAFFDRIQEVINENKDETRP